METRKIRNIIPVLARYKDKTFSASSYTKRKQTIWNAHLKEFQQPLCGVAGRKLYCVYVKT